jgi:putative transposase
VSLAALIAAQRATYGIPQMVSCRALGVSQAWFYKWRHGDGSPRRQRRKALAATIMWLFNKHKATYGSPRITADLQAMGWQRRVKLTMPLDVGGYDQLMKGAGQQWN